MQSIDVRRHRVHALLAGLAGAVLFAIRFDPRILDPRRVEWLLSYDDGAMFYFGWAFLRQAGWSFPLGHLDGYLAPGGTYAALTDSIPLIALPLRLVSSWLPEPFQYFGLWILGTCVLQGVLAWLLLARLVGDRTLRTVGFLVLLACPFFLHRTAHIALSSHAPILAALWLSVRLFQAHRPHQELGRWLWLAVLVAAIHPYLTAMVLPIAIATHADAYRAEGITGPRLAASVGALLGLTGLVWWVLGYLTGTAGMAAGSSQAYGMNLNAWYNPLDTSSFLDRMAIVGYPQEEGYGYLGLGGLALVGLGLVGVGLRPPAAGFGRRHAVLLCSLAGLLVFALSSRWTWHGYTLMKYDLPWPLDGLASIFRTSGRFHWPVTYALIAGTLLGIDRWLASVRRPAGRSCIRVVLVLLAVVQCADLWPLLAHSRGAKHPALGRAVDEQRFATRLQSAWWDEAAAGSRRITTVPPLQYSTQLPGDFKDLALLAMRHRIPVTAGYVARSSEERARRDAAQVRTELERGGEPGALYVFRSGELGRLGQTVADRLQCGVVDGLPVCTRPGRGVPPPSPIAISPSDLGTFLEGSAGAPLVALAVEDEATHMLSGQDRTRLREMGSGIDSLAYRGSYVGLLHRGRIVWERVDNGAAIHAHFPVGTTLGTLTLTRPLTVHSAGLGAGNRASVQAGHGPPLEGGRGFLTVAFDEALEPVAWAQFDTHAGTRGFRFDFVGR